MNVIECFRLKKSISLRPSRPRDKLPTYDIRGDTPKIARASLLRNHNYIIKEI